MIVIRGDSAVVKPTPTTAITIATLKLKAEAGY